MFRHYKNQLNYTPTFKNNQITFEKTYATEKFHRMKITQKDDKKR